MNKKTIYALIFAFFSVGLLISSLFFYPQSKILFENELTLSKDTFFIDHSIFPVKSRGLHLELSINCNNPTNISLFNNSGYNSWIEGQNDTHLYKTMLNGSVYQEITIPFNVNNHNQRVLTILIIADVNATNISYLLIGNFSRQYWQYGIVGASIFAIGALLFCFKRKKSL
jgi:hypothetical protein